MDERPAERVVVKQMNWLGDLVMATAALRAVRDAYPGAFLAVLVCQELASFYDGFDWVDEVIPYRLRPGSRLLVDQLAVVRRLRSGRFDLGITFPRSFRSAFWLAAAGVPRRIGLYAQWRRFLLTDGVARPESLLRRHQMHDYLYLLEATLGISGASGRCDLEVAAGHSEAMREWLRRRRRRAGKLVGLAVAASYGPAKEWPGERYAEVIDRLADGHGIECVLVGSPAERQRCEEVAAASHHGGLIAAGETSVGEALALLALCDGFIGNDSGSMHVAAALDIPTVGIFGSTRPHRTAPLGDQARVLYQQVECSPCMARDCRFGHYDCLRQITPDQVVAAIGGMLAAHN